MERSFKKEVQALKLGAGETFHGEGILAVTKALLQSGVSYVGGYQGRPVSHLLDVLVDAEDIIGDLGVHLETCTNEASAAAMLGASINYPLRGAVTWKSIVGTNVAADALSNLSSPGVVGGVMIILGEDYGEGASVIQERSYAYAMKSSMWLLDPRPDLPTIVRMVEEGFELSEASHAPVMMELRIRACHVTGEFKTKDNRRADFSGKNRIAGPPRFQYGRLAHPPVIFSQERLKVEERLPAAQQVHPRAQAQRGDPRRSRRRRHHRGRRAHHRRAARAGAARSCRPLRHEPHPDLRPQRRLSAGAEELREFCVGKRAVLVVEEGSPDYIEQAVNTELRRADIQTRVLGKGHLPRAGEYVSEVLINGLASFLAEARPNGIDRRRDHGAREEHAGAQGARDGALGDIPPRPPNFCTGCPERPVFSAIKLMQRELGPTHISADIGCHSFATFAPFSLGNSILGYGMSLASAAAVTPNMDRRPIAIMGDGGFWHNGLITGVASNLFNKGDGVLIVMQNGYASATGQQYLPSSAANRIGCPTGMTIEQTLRSLGVKWLRTVRSYSVAKMTKTLKEAMRTAERGLKVIIADGECQLARQRRVRARMPRSSSAASAWCGCASASTTRSAPATIPASGSPAAPRSRSSPIPTRCAATR
jgi:indolepyruvate ferredoxin oxidoreductase alpha subunit